MTAYRCGDGGGTEALAVTVRDGAESGAVVLALAGELDLGTVHVFIDALDSVLASEPASIELDLSALSFIDSSGVGAYVRAYRRARSKGTAMSVGARSALVERVLQISGVEEALAAEAS